MKKQRVQKIAFYAPLKSPQHAQPSGDRLIAQLLFKALQQAGFEVELVSQFRSRDGNGDSARQARMVRFGERLAKRLLGRWKKQGTEPDIWFCYHNYYKAPDLIGPVVAEQLNIPYWVAEASWAQKRAKGPWQSYHTALARGLRMAAGAFILNPHDQASLIKALPSTAKFVQLPAFLDLETLDRQWAPEPLSKKTDTPPKLVAVAMLRPGDKLQSLAILAQALNYVKHPYKLHIIGDGKARLRAKSLFTGLPVHFEGKLEDAALRRFIGSCDLLVWPAVNEAIGMALLEAQSCAVPVLVGNEGGTASVVNHKVSGELVAPRDSHAFAQALDKLLFHPELLMNYRRNARPYVQRTHGMSSAAEKLKEALNS